MSRNDTPGGRSRKQRSARDTLVCASRYGLLLETRRRWKVWYITTSTIILLRRDRAGFGFLSRLWDRTSGRESSACLLLTLFLHAAAKSVCRARLRLPNAQLQPRSSHTGKHSSRRKGTFAKVAHPRHHLSLPRCSLFQRGGARDPAFRSGQKHTCTP